MPSRFAHKAALRRANEPGVIAPEGVTLPELPDRMGWRNPVRGYDYVRDEWSLYRVLPGGSETLATIRRVDAEQWAVELHSGPRLMSQSVTDATAAFTIAAEWGRRQS